MGLDMYLTKRVYVGANYEHRNITGTIDIKAGDKPININLKKVSKIICSVAYWCKANHIHKWFVDNCQDGEDDCREAYVSLEKLSELKKLCAEVLSISKDENLSDEQKQEKYNELLPTASGFFFGGTDYDEYYIQNIQYTFDFINEELSDEDNKYCDYYYQSSW